ncbi:fatty-acyl-CoA synthase [Afipia massiliensis]|uniref:3-methylmercaptopropionyl-CoA ligase n=1 Tax=Afipia massiliensis TaxID=211460 RepID=A0A840N2Q5_9BRAD|nr:acyl-CoA synthetase [Afipia massiliensis]MBB5051016.1 fatty-acyl-CoA synthase [Afipia massiliensis]
MSSQGQYSIGLDKNAANYVPLSPLSFLVRSASVYPDHTSAIYEGRSFTWAQTYERCKRFASFLAQRGIQRGDTVAAMLPNIPAMNEVHFAVPMAGGVLNALNIRLDAASIAFQLDHGGAKIILVDPEFTGVISDALDLMKGSKPLVIDVDDAAFPGGKRIGELEYEAAVASGDPEFAWLQPQDEWDAIALGYTSGTTGNPKGVVTHYRGAYLNAVSNILAGNLGTHPIYLWTLPMFHCNGWCFPWTIAASAGINVCLRKVDPAKIFELIKAHGVTHMCGAPIVFNTLINAPSAPKGKSTKPVVGLIAGAAPPVAVLEGAENIGIKLTHVYGLTEVYGPASVCAEQPGWDDLPADQRAQLKRRQGVPYPLQEAVTVLDPETMQPVPRDGETIGEVMFRGNIVMKGYLKNEKATREAFEGGWFHTGDLGVLDEFGYVIIKDRSKDIIISGGENISSVEVEDVLYKHPAILFAAVVAKPDPKWGEVPCAFVELKEGATATEAEILAYCKSILPGFKSPKSVVFGAIPKTSTGKIQKFMLRDQANSAKAISA